MHCDAALFGGVLAQVQSRVDLFAKNSLESFRQGFAQFQTESHGVLRQGESYVAVALFACDFPPKPPRCFEPATAGGIRKFHLGNYKTGMSTPINIQLDQQIFPRNFVAHFS